jgi:hypothetical protein
MMAFRLRIESDSAPPSPTLILNAPADFQLIVVPLGRQSTLACSFNPRHYGRDTTLTVKFMSRACVSDTSRAVIYPALVPSRPS